MSPSSRWPSASTAAAAVGAPPNAQQQQQQHHTDEPPANTNTQNNTHTQQAGHALPPPLHLQSLHPLAIHPLSSPGSASPVGSPPAVGGAPAAAVSMRPLRSGATNGGGRAVKHSLTVDAPSTHVVVGAGEGALSPRSLAKRMRTGEHTPGGSTLSLAQWASDMPMSPCTTLVQQSFAGVKIEPHTPQAGANSSSQGRASLSQSPTKEGLPPTHPVAPHPTYLFPASPNPATQPSTAAYNNGAVYGVQGAQASQSSVSTASLHSSPTPSDSSTGSLSPPSLSHGGSASSSSASSIASTAATSSTSPAPLSPTSLHVSLHALSSLSAAQPLGLPPSPSPPPARTRATSDSPGKTDGGGGGSGGSGGSTSRRRKAEQIEVQEATVEEEEEETGKKGKSENRQGASCHQCKTTKDEQHLLFCTTKAGGNRKRRCRKKYCDSCLSRTYNTSMQAIQSNPHALATWQCPSCMGKCTCAGCTRKGVQGKTGTASRENSSNSLSSMAIPPTLMEQAANTNNPSSSSSRSKQTSIDSNDNHAGLSPPPATAAAAASSSPSIPSPSHRPFLPSTGFGPTLPSASLLSGRAASAPVSDYSSSQLHDPSVYLYAAHQQMMAARHMDVEGGEEHSVKQGEEDGMAHVKEEGEEVAAASGETQADAAPQHMDAIASLLLELSTSSASNTSLSTSTTSLPAASTSTMMPPSSLPTTLPLPPASSLPFSAGTTALPLGTSSIHSFTTSHLGENIRAGTLRGMHPLTTTTSTLLSTSPYPLSSTLPLGFLSTSSSAVASATSLPPASSTSFSSHRFSGSPSSLLSSTSSKPAVPFSLAHRSPLFPLGPHPSPALAGTASAYTKYSTILPPAPGPLLMGGRAVSEHGLARSGYPPSGMQM